MGGAQSSDESGISESSANSVESPSSTEEQERVSGPNVSLSTQVILDVSTAVCKVTVQNDSGLQSGTGFLAEFATTTAAGSHVSVHGLFTSDHVLPEKCLADDQTFTVTFGAVRGRTSTPVAKTLKNDGLFRFTCPILGATFVKFTEEDVQSLISSGCHFLRAAADWAGSKDVPLFAFEHPGHSVAQGNCLEINGFDICHSASTNYTSSGSPIALSDGRVVGLHKAHSTQSSTAVAMKSIVNALLPHFHGPTLPCCLICNPVTLDPTYAAKLLEIGLQPQEASSNFPGLLYVSPASAYVTPIWFVPTSHGWFWTPTDPSDQNEKTNWMSMSQLQAIGGCWDNQTPADKNVRIIGWLDQHNIVSGTCPSIH